MLRAAYARFWLVSGFLCSAKYDTCGGVGYPSRCRVMGNAVANGVPAPNSNSTLLRLRRGKKSAGCPCFLAEHAPTWETLTLHDKFRSYVLRHLLDEGFICSVLEHGEREHALAACAGVQYYEVGYRFCSFAVPHLYDRVRMLDEYSACNF